jgi:superfamily II RNA helicase
MIKEYHIADIVLELERCNLLPTIVFRTSRSQCDSDILKAVNSKALALPILQQRAIKDAVYEIARNYEMELDLITTHPHYSSLIKTGIVAHHAGQLLMWRLLLEELMSLGLLKVLCATGTVAAGVDFPARTAVVTAHTKRGHDGYNRLLSTEFQQMSGRAGRRGKDTVGFCIAAPSAFCDARELLKLSKTPPEPLMSSYFPSPSTVLNLLRYRNVDDLRFTVERSLASFADKKQSVIFEKEAEEVDEKIKTKQELIERLKSSQKENEGKALAKLVKKARRLRTQAEELKSKQGTLLDRTINGLRKLGHLNEFALSDKGYWSANLCTGMVLELAEIIEAGYFDRISPERLATILAGICGEDHRQYLKAKKSPLSDADIEGLNAILKRVQDMDLPGSPTETNVIVSNAAYTMEVWLQAENWQEFRALLLLNGAAEGDAARLITQTAEHLNQLKRLEETFPKLAKRAEEARRRILRPPLTEAINLDVGV